MKLTLYGPIPSKKNKLRPRSGKGRAYHYDKETADQIEALTTFARIQWGPRPPLVHPEMELMFFVLNPAKDQDGMYTCLLDCLKQARVIQDDSIKWLNGKVTIHPAHVVSSLRDERVEIEIQ